LKNSVVFPSTKVILKDRIWPRTSRLLCQFAPQFLCMGTHVLVVEPLIHTAFASPLPPTLEIITILKFDCPFKVKRTPPLLLHDTLQPINITTISSSQYSLLYIHTYTKTEPEALMGKGQGSKKFVSRNQ
jgi:hypothetical protein